MTGDQDQDQEGSKWWTWKDMERKRNGSTEVKVYLKFGSQIY